MTTFITDARVRFAYHCKFKCTYVPKVEVVRLIMANGVTQYLLRCCEKHRPTGAVYSFKLTEQERENSIIWRNNIGRYHKNACAHCGDLKTELHHWAPVALFGDDAGNWPTSYLCTFCHRYWHQVMNKNKNAN